MDGWGASRKYEDAELNRKTLETMASIRPKSAMRTCRNARRPSGSSGTVTRSSSEVMARGAAAGPAPDSIFLFPTILPLERQTIGPPPQQGTTGVRTVVRGQVVP